MSETSSLRKFSYFVNKSMNQNTELRDESQSQERSSSLITNLHEMLKSFANAHCLVRITSFTSVDIYPEHNFPKILRHLKLSLFPTFYNYLTNQSVSRDFGKGRFISLWSFSWVEKFATFQSCNGTYNCLKLTEGNIRHMKGLMCLSEVVLFPPPDSVMKLSLQKPLMIEFYRIIVPSGIWYLLETHLIFCRKQNPLHICS